MSFTELLEEDNRFRAEQRGYADDGRISLSALRRLDKKCDDIMLAVNQVWPKLAQMESKIGKLELALDKLLSCRESNTEHDAHNSRQRCLKLQFTNNIPAAIWTGDEIRGDGGEYIKVALVDEMGKLVNFGPESSGKVLIFAFKGDADDNEEDAGEIGRNSDDLTGERKTKKSTLVGDVLLKLSEGNGTLGNIKFRNCSSHMSGVFKLGAQLVDRFDGIVVKGAKTVSFRVKDYRGKYKEKHHPPLLLDEIWRLENIGNVGPVNDRLKNQKLNTVEDFLLKLLIDSDNLKKLVGLPPKKWEATVKHALTCQLDKKMYCSMRSEENKGIVFNVVGKVLGLIVDSKYVPLHQLSDEAKADASKLDIAAFVHKSGLFSFEDEPSLLQHFSRVINVLQPSNSSRSQSIIDHEDQVSEVAESQQTNLYTSFEDVPSSSCITGGASVTEDDFLLDDQFLQSILWDAPMFLEAPVVADDEVKKKLFMLFSVTKWFLNFERIAASDENDNQKRRRIS